MDRTGFGLRSSMERCRWGCQKQEADYEKLMMRSGGL
jgi:hypothetical protein